MSQLQIFGVVSIILATDRWKGSGLFSIFVSSMSSLISITNQSVVLLMQSHLDETETEIIVNRQNVI